MKSSQYILFLLLFCFMILLIAGEAQSGGKTKLRCWSCGKVFMVDSSDTSPRCPACGVACRRKAEINLKIHCLESGEGCSFILACPDGSTIVFVGVETGKKVDLAGYLKKLGVKNIEVLIGSVNDWRCINAMLKLMRDFKVNRVFDPGFKRNQWKYGDYLSELKKSGAQYRIVRAIESFKYGNVRMYLARPSSFNVSGGDDSSLYLGVVYRNNSFLLTRNLHGSGSSLQSLLSSGRADMSDFFLQGTSHSLDFKAAPPRGSGTLVIESDGKSMEVKDLKNVFLSSSPGEALKVITKGGDATPETREKASVPSFKININTAGVDELSKLSGIGLKKAQNIIDYRQSHGPFTAIDDIKKVSGIGEKLFQRNKDSICVE